MKKAQLVEIGKQPFYINETAHKNLSKYLKDIRKHYDDDEVIEDIELSIAEKLLAQLKDKNTVVDDSNIKAVIEQLGTVADITGDDKASAPPQQNINKRLFRSRENRYLGGVSAGLAAYFSVDPTIVRLIFIIGAIISFGTIVFVYVLFWLILPEATSIEDEQAMRGRATTLKDIEEVARDKASEITEQNKSTPARIAKGFVGAVGTFGRLTLRFSGLIILISAVAALIGISMGFGSLLFNTTDVFFGNQFIANFPGGSADRVLIIALWAAAAVVVGLLAYLGLALLRLKNVLTGATTGLMIAVLVASLTTAGILGVRASDRVQDVAVGPTVSEEVALSSFSTVKVEDQIQVTIERSDDYRMVITSPENHRENFSYEVKDGELQLENRDDFDHCILWCNTDIQVTVYAPDVDQVKAEDQAKVDVGGLTVQRVIGSDQSDIYIELGSIEKFWLNLEDQAKLVMACESATELLVKMEDQATANTNDCPAATANLDQQDQSYIQLNVTDTFIQTRSDDQSIYKLSGDAQILR